MTLENIQKEAVERFREKFGYKTNGNAFFAAYGCDYLVEQFIENQIATAYQKGKEEGLLSKEK